MQGIEIILRLIQNKYSSRTRLGIAVNSWDMNVRNGGVKSSRTRGGLWQSKGVKPTAKPQSSREGGTSIMTDT